MTFAAFTSAFSVCPQATHAKIARDGRLAAATCQHTEHVWLVGSVASGGGQTCRGVVTTLGQAALVSFRKADSSLDPKQAAETR
jgi:hypothetical protein